MFSRTKIPGFLKQYQKYLCFFLLIISAGCAPVSEGGRYYAAVDWVADGDTIKLVNGEFVRYIGIDTPEMHYPKGPAEYLAKEAKEFNEKLVANKVVRLQFDAQRRDRYKRLLAYVYVDDTLVNARLLEEGYARIFTFPPNIKYADEFLKLQNKAREEKRGLWK